MTLTKQKPVFRFNAVVEGLGMSRSTALRRIEAGTFPKPINNGGLQVYSAEEIPQLEAAISCEWSTDKWQEFNSKIYAARERREQELLASMESR